MPTTSPNNISYDEINPSEMRRSPVEQWRGDGTFVAKRILKCDWGDRYLLISDIGANGGEIYPHLPQIGARAGAAQLVASGQSQPSSGLLVHDSAYVEISYFWSPSLPTWIEAQGLLVSEKITGGLMYETLDPETLIWGDGQTVVEASDAPGVPFPVLYYELTLHQVSTEPQLVYSLIGKVNANIVNPYIFNYSFPIETLLYSGVVSKKSVGLGTNDKKDFTQRFIYKVNGWNKWFNAGAGANGEWQRILRIADAGQITPFPLVNF